MKTYRSIALSILLILCISPVVSAKSGHTSRSYSNGTEVDGSFGVASGPGPYSDGSGVSFGVGFGLDRNVQMRFDISYFDFSYDYYGSGFSYTRVPFTFGPRVYLPLAPRVRFFGQAGLEISFDSFNYVDPYGNEASKSETNFGITPGGGVDIMISPKVSLFALGRWHLITDDYASLEFGAGVHF